MKIEIDGILPAVGSMPITEWEIYVDGEKQIIRSFESRGFKEFAIEVEPLVVIKKSLEEEKKMLNVEKYLNAIKEELSKDACASKSCLVAKVRGGGRKPDCDNRLCRDCEEASVDWLFSEYTPPLLENGDNLKPGDWIMVRDRDGDKWQKRQFMCYFQSLDRPFVTLEEMHGWYVGKHECWEQARLPENGE